MKTVKEAIRKYGWRPDLPDSRDLHYTVTAPIATPDELDLSTRPFEPPIWDQGNLGSCTAHGIGYIDYFIRAKAKLPPLMPSRLLIYYNERDAELTVSLDSGAMIRDGIKVLGKLGVCDEKLWPYDISKFTKRPPAKCYTEALKHKALLYQRVAQTESMMQQCLAIEGNPIVIGFSVYNSFEGAETAKTGIVQMPKPGEKMIGGHCVAIVGYNKKTRMWKIRNSWGPKWGDRGYCYFPFDYLTNSNLSDDFWAIRQAA